MIGVRTRALRMSRQTSNPSRPGSITSRTIRSHPGSTPRRLAVGPSRTTSTVCPSAVRSSFRNIAMSRSSSTTRIRARRIYHPPSVRQHDAERAAFSRRALQAKRAAVGVDDVLHHRQTDAGALDAGGVGCRAADELAQDLPLFGRRYAEAVVLHADGNPGSFPLDVHAVWSCTPGSTSPRCPAGSRSRGPGLRDRRESRGGRWLPSARRDSPDRRPRAGTRPPPTSPALRRRGPASDRPSPRIPCARSRAAPRRASAAGWWPGRAPGSTSHGARPPAAGLR